ncbi:MAG: glycosyltransferase family 2 protein [Desulfitobacteriaceae bacterium]|nr:glycosyltransferase family 2 protein [Desulfitobacteriaceae bacterium]MDD4753578.1 glycosyltransferase family 2 protein [Desulfitobacteriaceae bacterium]
MLNGITIAICTRNRPDDLFRCVQSIANQKNIPSELAKEVLIIDDGELAEHYLDAFKKILSHPKINLRYVKKDTPGLLLSRTTAVNQANFDIILFLDDDVEIADNYLSLLYDTYCRFNNVAGIGGIDTIMKSGGRFWSWISRFFCLDSGHPGKLSPSSKNSSIFRWNKMVDIFETEFLSGCNMSFKKSSLKNLQPVEWLSSYSLGEDIYLSYLAQKEGPLFVNPDLKVKHYWSQISRDKAKDVAFTETVNHFHLLKLLNPKWWNYLCFLWTHFGLLITSLLFENSRPKVSGYIKGLHYLFNRWYRRQFRRSKETENRS